MRLWDSSAVVALLVDEPVSGAASAALDEDHAVAAWWGTPVECVSAITRREREGALSPGDVAAALRRLASLEAAWVEVQPTPALRAVATRLLRVHALRAADALQLAAAVVLADGAPGSVTIVTADDRLALAADREGFPVVQPR